MNKPPKVTTKPGELLNISLGTAVYKTKEEALGRRLFPTSKKTLSGAIQTNSVHFISEETTVMILSEEITTVRLSFKGIKKVKLFSFILNSQIYWATANPKLENGIFNKPEYYG